MNSIIQLTKPGKTSISNSEKTFNKLRKKVEDLEEELKEFLEQLDKSLTFHHEQLYPAKIALAHVLTEFVKVLYEYYKSPLSKKDLRNLKDIILIKIESIFEVTLFCDVDPAVHAIYKDLEGVGYEEQAADDLDEMKEQMEEMFREQGIDIDLSSINFTDDKDEIERKMFESMQFAKKRVDEKPAKPKDKKQLQKEEKAKQLQTLKEKGLSTLYKNLAKEFHPDLEPSPALKIEKEQLMKRLTLAYEKDDLYAILKLEMEWSKRAKGQKIFNPSQLNVYNSILKDQITALEECIGSVLTHPKYLPLEPHFPGILFGVSIEQSLTTSYQEAISDKEFYEDLLLDLKGENGKKTLWEILSSFDK